MSSSPGFKACFPDLRGVSEEDSEPADICSLGKCYLLVDPLDGTREFLAGRDEYTVEPCHHCGGPSPGMSPMAIASNGVCPAPSWIHKPTSRHSANSRM